MSARLWKLSACFALLLSACGGSSAPGGPCSTNLDCVDGEVCVAGGCQATSQAVGCTGDDQCAAGEMCDLVSETCIAIQVVTCTTDRECPSHQVCNTLTGVCIDGRRTCTDDTQCPGGMCDLALQQCVECINADHCGMGQACTNGACVDLPPPPLGGCQMDAECGPPAQICMAGACVLGCGQPTGLMCEAGEVCDTRNGRCVSIRGPCSQDSECGPPNEVCESGQCIPGCGQVGGIQCNGGFECNANTGRCVPLDNICLSDLECNNPSEICNLNTGACDPGCGTSGCTGGKTCNTSTGHCEDGTQCSPDRLEPNNTAAAASPAGGTMVAMTACPGDDDFFSVAVGAGDDVDADLMFVHGEGNIDLELLDPSGAVVAQSTGQTGAESIQHVAQAAGTYTFRVFLSRDLGPSPGNTYSITIDALAAPCADDSYEENDSLFTSAFITPGNIASLHSCDADDDYFDIFVEEGEELSVDVTFSQAEGDIDVAILGSFGFPETTGISSTDNENLTYTAESTGFYTIQVTLYEDLGSVAGNPYGLNVTIGAAPPAMCGSDALEENDTFLGASQLSPGVHNNLNVCDNDDDFYQVTLGAGEQITVDAQFTDAEGDIDIELLDANNTRLASGTTASNDESFSFTAVTAGTYTLRVYLYLDAGSAPGNTYTIDVATTGAAPICIADSFEPNDTPTTPSPLTFGVHNNLGACGEEDYYAITLSAGNAIVLDVAFSHAEGDIDVLFYDPSGSLAVSSVTTDDDESLTHTAAISGTYTLWVRLYADQGTMVGNNYDLTMSP